MFTFDQTQKRAFQMIYVGIEVYRESFVFPESLQRRLRLPELDFIPAFVKITFSIISSDGNYDMVKVGESSWLGQINHGQGIFK